MWRKPTRQGQLCRLFPVSASRRPYRNTRMRGLRAVRGSWCSSCPNPISCRRTSSRPGSPRSPISLRGSRGRSARARPVAEYRPAVRAGRRRGRGRPPSARFGSEPQLRGLGHRWGNVDPHVPPRCRRDGDPWGLAVSPSCSGISWSSSPRNTRSRASNTPFGREQTADASRSPSTTVTRTTSPLPTRWHGGRSLPPSSSSADSSEATVSSGGTNSSGSCWQLRSFPRRSRSRSETSSSTGI